MVKMAIYKLDQNNRKHFMKYMVSLKHGILLNNTCSNSYDYDQLTSSIDKEYNSMQLLHCMIGVITQLKPFIRFAEMQNKIAFLHFITYKDKYVTTHDQPISLLKASASAINQTKQYAEELSLPEYGIVLSDCENRVLKDEFCCT